MYLYFHVQQNVLVGSLEGAWRQLVRVIMEMCKVCEECTEDRGVERVEEEEYVVLSVKE